MYSEFLDDGFRINYLLFGGESTHNVSKLQNLFKAPLYLSFHHATFMSIYFRKVFTPSYSLHVPNTIQAFHAAKEYYLPCLREQGETETNH